MAQYSSQQYPNSWDAYLYPGSSEARPSQQQNQNTFQWPAAAQAASGQQTSEVQQPMQISKTEQEANNISIGWIIVALVLAGCVIFFGARKLTTRRSQAMKALDAPKLGPNDRRMLDLAKAIATVYEKT